MRKFNDGKNGLLGIMPTDEDVRDFKFKNLFKSKARIAKENFLNKLEEIKTFAEGTEDTVIKYYICKYGVEQTKTRFGLHHINQHFLDEVDTNGPLNNSNIIEVGNLLEQAEEYLRVLNYTLLPMQNLQHYKEADMALFLAIQNKMTRFIDAGKEILN